MAISEEFKKYAWSSVQLDQYFAAIKVFSFHYEALKATYGALPRGKDWPEDLASWQQAAQKFFQLSASTFNYMGTTGIFDEAPYPELNSLPDDVRRIGFDTCFCFQWALFENFVTQTVFDLVARQRLSGHVSSKIMKLERRTEALLRYIK